MAAIVEEAARRRHYLTVRADSRTSAIDTSVL